MFNFSTVIMMFERYNDRLMSWFSVAVARGSSQSSQSHQLGYWHIHSLRCLSLSHIFISVSSYIYLMFSPSVSFVFFAQLYHICPVSVWPTDLSHSHCQSHHIFIWYSVTVSVSYFSNSYHTCPVSVWPTYLIELGIQITIFWKPHKSYIFEAKYAHNSN